MAYERTLTPDTCGGVDKYGKVTVRDRLQTQLTEHATQNG